MDSGAEKKAMLFSHEIWEFSVEKKKDETHELDEPECSHVW